jgi:sugar phosphate isomerase/epimerase
MAKTTARKKTASPKLPLKLACADFSFPLVSHEETLDLISWLGFDGVDIGLFPDRSHFQPKDYVKNVASAARELSLRVQDRGLEFADIFLQNSSNLEKMAPNNPSATERRRWRELFLRTLELTARCNASHMTALPGVHFEKESREDSLKRASDELAWCVEQATAMGVVFSVEPHMWSVAPNTKLAAKLARTTPGLTLTLDYGHYTAQGESDRTIEPLMKYASHFHARAACKGLLQTTMARNTINYAGVVRAMKRAKFSGFIGVEYVRMGLDIVPDVDNLSETVIMRDLIRKAWGARS